MSLTNKQIKDKEKRADKWNNMGPVKFLYQALSLDGSTQDDASTNMTGNYATPTEFWIEPPVEDLEYFVSKLVIFMQVTGTIDSGNYGGAGGALTNGIKFFFREGGEYIFIAPESMIITTNPDWDKLGADEHKLHSYGAGDDVLTLVVNFKDTMGSPVSIKKGEQLGVILEDDFSTRNFVEHKIVAHGNYSNYTE